MESTHILSQKLEAWMLPPVFSDWYPDPAAQLPRYAQTIRGFEAAFGPGRKAALFSSPGRCEFIGNHTDHQLGHVVAAAITLDMIAVVSPNGTQTVRMVSEGYPSVSVDLEDLAPRPREKGNPAALVRGMAAALTRFGFSPGGFDAYLSSRIPAGAGLSSSAALECLIGAIFNTLFCGEAVSAVQVARAGRFAESEYFGKPCGLMDQLACAVGGFAAMDLADPANPLVERVCSPLAQHGFCLYVVNTGGSHADLTGQYAAVREEMRSVAACLGYQALRQIPEGEFWAQIGKLHLQVSDRAICRAIHFFAEDRRAADMAQALRTGQMTQILRLITESGRSSQQLLQNAWPDGRPEERGISLALALSEHLLQQQGACRVHGGGFAGSILALVPQTLDLPYQQGMEAVFGRECCRRLAIRPCGAAAVGSWEG